MLNYQNKLQALITSQIEREGVEVKLINAILQTVLNKRKEE